MALALPVTDNLNAWVIKGFTQPRIGLIQPRCGVIQSLNDTVYVVKYHILRVAKRSLSYHDRSEWKGIRSSSPALSTHAGVERIKAIQARLCAKSEDAPYTVAIREIQLSFRNFQR